MNKHPLLLSAVLVPVVLAAPLPRAQEPNELPSRSASEFLSDWCVDHGESWQVQRDERGVMLFGGSAAASVAPNRREDWYALGRSFLSATGELFAVRSETLVEHTSTFLPLSQAGSSDKWTVTFDQVLDGVPVVGGHVSLLFDPWGSLLSIHSTAAPDLPERVLPTALSAVDAELLATDHFSARSTLPVATRGAPVRAFVRAPRGERLTAVLTWQVDVSGASRGVAPEAWRFWIDAASGALVDSTPLVHNLDVTGTVTSLATPGTDPDSASNGETQQALPHIFVSSSAGTVTADANGNFNFPGVNTALDVTVEYVGLWNDVRNEVGSDYSLTVQVQPDTPTTLLMNPAADALVTAQANAYLGVNQLHDWVESILPSDTIIDFQAVSNCNLNSTCNAFFNGSSINFYQEGGGCVNTSYSTVVAHEQGHWLNNLYGTFNGGDGMGEGNADVFANYLYDVPIVGEDFCGLGCHIRDGNNTRQYCGDGNGGCYGEVHADGEVWMGAAWKVRENLDVTHGNTAGDLAADTLFLSWMTAYNQAQITSLIETQWLTLDDDDGNINNGTPNYDDIDAGFRAQGFPGFDVPFVQFSNVTQLGDTQDEAGPYLVDATIVAGVAPPLSSATLRYRLLGGSFTDVAMASIGGDTYRGAIPGQPSPAELEYYITATDNSANTETFPADAPTDTLEFRVGVVTAYLGFDFDAGSDEGWTVGFTGDDATTGVWERVDPVGTGAQPEDDHTLPPGTVCWVTGQQPAGGSLGTNDVDDGTTTLVSPVFDASGLTDPEIRYWRWYSNDLGNAPNTDQLEVYLSNDGGSTWVVAEIVGPTGAETSGGWREQRFKISSLLVPTASMRLRFAASDLGDGSIVEAALDDLLGEDLGPVFVDCNNNGVDDSDDISSGTSLDCDLNGVPDECQADCDGDGLPDACEIDCNSNGTPDDCETFTDCNTNGIPDECEADCDGDSIPDDCEADCNGNGTPDDCESFTDCNTNGIPDECEPDCDGDSIPDDCEADCNGNGTPDDCESFTDCNTNGIPDECEPDCDGDSIPDDCEADCNGNGTPDDCESFNDCNANGVPDECEPDCDGDGLPDDCEADCNGNGTPDDCESFADCNSNGIPDDCEPDCDGDGLPDDCEADCNGNGTPDDCESFTDCNSNGIPDDCEPDCDGDGLPDDCEADCNGNGTPDDCESFTDCNSNGVPDECESDCDGDGVPDECEVDCNGNGTPDECESIGTTFCPSLPNSTGAGATLSATGSVALADNCLTLTGTDMPASQMALVIVSDNRDDVPIELQGGAGRVCLGTPSTIHTTMVGVDGSLSFGVDFNSLPNGLSFQSGETWAFQLWFQDGASTNTSNAVSFTFQ